MKTSEESESKTEVQSKENLSAVTQSYENSSVRIENDGYKISVKPIAGQNSFFNFMSPDGHYFQGTTNAELSFENSSEKKQFKTEKRFFSLITYKSQSTYKTQTTFKTVTKHSEKLKIYSIWYIWITVGFLLSYLLKSCWKWIKKSNWFTVIYERLNKIR